MLNTFQLRTRLFAAFGLMAVFSLAAGLLNFWSVRELGGNLETVAHQSVPRLRASMNADMSHDCARAALFRAVIGFETKNAAEITEGVKEFRESTKTHGDDLAAIGKSNPNPAIEAALQRTSAGLSDYIAAGEAVATLIQNTAPENEVHAAVSAFQIVFESLAVSMEKLSDVIQADAQSTQNVGEVVARKSFWVAGVSAMVAVLCAVCIALALDRQISRPLSHAVASLAAATVEVSSASNTITGSSQTLAESASNQAASLEETSASLEEMTSMTKRNAANAASGKELSQQARQSADAGIARVQEMDRTIGGIKGSVAEMESAVRQIRSSSEEVGKIIKTIDEIAFQTNLLALNAAVEAARAGEAGMGFAVVADEVRVLAQRSAAAARETAEKIEKAIKSSEEGVRCSQRVVKSLGDVETTSGDVQQGIHEIAGRIASLEQISGEIAVACSEQSEGTAQVNLAVSQMDKVTQSNAATAEEQAAAAEELNGQAAELEGCVAQLEALVNGGGAPHPVPLAGRLDRKRYKGASAGLARPHFSEI